MRKKIYSLITAMIMLVNILMPTVSSAAELVKSSGTVTFSVERRVLGQPDIISEKQVKLTNGQSEKASYVLDRALREAGLEYDNTGTLDSSFYLSWIELTDSAYGLGEFDHGTYSGWKYSVNGVFPSIGFSDYTLKPGDKVRVCYTAKDMGGDIILVDAIDELKSSTNIAKAYDSKNYTYESFKKLEEAITNADQVLSKYSNIGPMVSTELGDGNLNTNTALNSDVKPAISGLTEAVNSLIEEENKGEEDNRVTPKVDYDLDIYNWSDSDSIYLREDENSITVLLTRVSEGAQIKVNGELLKPYEGNKYIGTLKVGRNIITIPRYGDFVDQVVNVEKLPYKIEGNLVPGEKVTITFDKIEQQIPNLSKYPLIESQTKYKTDIEGLKEVKSELVEGQKPSFEKLSKITFTIPKDTEIGTYTLTNGYVYHAWDRYQSGSTSWDDGTFARKFSKLPDIKLEIGTDKGEGEGGGTEDSKDAPTITTDLVDGKVVNNSKFKFSASSLASNGVAAALEVKLDGDVIEATRKSVYDVRLLEGKNVITIEATDRSGNIKTETYIIKCENIVLKEGASIILDSESLKLEVGDTHQIIAVDAPDGRSESNEATERMVYEVASGSDVVKVSRYGKITALKTGTAKVSVTYPGLKKPGIIVVNVVSNKNSSAPKITTTIKESKYDTFYYTNGNSTYTFEATSKEADDIEVKVNDKVISSSNGKYSVKLQEGNNVICVKATKGSNINEELFNVKAKPVTISVENDTNPGKDIIQGDKVKISFKGLETPVPKVLRIFNPKNTRVSYSVDMPGMTGIFGEGTQYDLPTNNAIEFVATKSGTFSFTGGCIDESWWGDVLYSEREITDLPPNTTALVREGVFSTLPDFKVTVKENKNYKEKFTAVVESDGELNNSNTVKPGQEIEINIDGLKMPQIDGDIQSAKTIFNTNIKGLEVIESEKGQSKSKSNISKLKFTLPENLEDGTYTVTNGRMHVEWLPTNFILTIQKEFFKGELPEIKLIVKSRDGVVPPVETVDVDELTNIAAKWVIENSKNATFGDEWKIFGLVRGGLGSKEIYNTYYKNLVKVVKEKNGVLTRNKYTEYSRIIITLTALGYDPTDVGGYNLVEKLYDLNMVSRQGINGVIFALIALDTNDYKIEGNKNSRDEMIKFILDSQLSDGGFTLSGDKGEVDITAMAIQALAKYKNRADVKPAIEKALNFLSKRQCNSGGYATEDGENLESSAQVLVAINSLGISAKDERFIKNGNTIVDAMSKYAVSSGGFKHILSENAANFMATEQALYALVSQKRLNEGKISLYDMSDATSDEGNDGNGDGNGSDPEPGGDGGNHGSGDGNGLNPGPGGDGGNHGSGDGNGSNQGSGGNDGNNGNGGSPSTSDQSQIGMFLAISMIASVSLVMINRKRKHN